MLQEKEPRKALGRGLESLLPSPRAAAAAAAPAPARESAASELPLDRIEPNPYQPRGHADQANLAELTASIAASGVLQPILVRPLADGRYQLIAGERRWRASQHAGKTTIPAVIKQVSNQQALEMTIVENL